MNAWARPCAQASRRRSKARPGRAADQGGHERRYQAAAGGARARADQPDRANGRCDLGAAIEAARARMAVVGRLLPMATLRDSGGECRLHKAVPGQQETFAPTLTKTLERQPGLDNSHSTDRFFERMIGRSGHSRRRRHALARRF